MTHSDRIHSTISPSKLKAIEISPAFVPDPTNEEHPITAEGTLCHEALDSGNDDKLNEEQKRWVKMCRDYVAGVFPRGEGYNEVKLEILDGIWGYADKVVINHTGESAALFDYKFGYVPQEDVETNPAAQAYVFGMFQKWPKLVSVFVAYLYPRLENVSYHCFNRDDLPRIETRVRLIVEKARDAKPETCRWSPDTCRWCQHRATCSTLAKEVLPIATRYAETHSLPLPSFDNLTTLEDPEKFSRLLAAVPVLEAAVDSIKRNALRLRTEMGVEIPGYELRSRAGKKKVINPVMAWEVAKKLGFTQDQFLAAVDVSVPALEKTAADVAPRGKKGKLISALNDELRDAGILDIGPEIVWLQKAK